MQHHKKPTKPQNQKHKIKAKQNKNNLKENKNKILPHRKTPNKQTKNIHLQLKTANQKQNNKTKQRLLQSQTTVLLVAASPPHSVY